MSRRRFPWITASTVAISASASFLVPGDGEFLQYARESAWWTVLSGQLVHWSPRMALVDLGVVTIAGSWVEMRSRFAVALTMVVSAVACGTILPWTDLDTYRGISGVAVALVVFALLDLSRSPGSRTLRRIAGFLLILTVAKIALEWSSGRALAAGPLPPGVRVATDVHVVGALTGVVAFVVWRAAKAANWTDSGREA